MIIGREHQGLQHGEAQLHMYSLFSLDTQRQSCCLVHICTGDMAEVCNTWILGHK